MRQRTIGEIVEIKNIGIHSGKKVNMRMLPANQDVGIMFRRSDIDSDWIKLSYDKVKTALLCTQIQQNNIYIKTIEHLISALSMLAIDNVYIEVDSYELPIMDGSAMPFIFLIKEAGIKELSSFKKMVKIKKDIEVVVDDKFIKVSPSSDFIINYEIDFEHPLIKNTNQKMTINIFKDNVVDSISRARTFGFLSDIEYLKANNLAKGGGVENAVILDNFNIINKDGLRYEDEFLRHKVLDMIGDLYVDGMYFMGEFTAYKSGHMLNNKILTDIFSNQENYEIIELKDSESINEFNPLDIPVFTFNS